MGISSGDFGHGFAHAGVRFCAVSDDVQIRYPPVEHLDMTLGALRQLRIMSDHDDGGAVIVDLFEQLHHLSGHG